MATEELDFWYDGQIRRITMQILRIFSHFKYAQNFNSDGSYTLKKVPARMAMTNRQTAHILKNNSENVMLTVPSIAVSISNVTYDRDRVQEPFHVNKVQIWERNYDPETKTYGDKVGGTYTLERYMAIPITIEIQVDIWVSNQEQKNQLFEQIMVLFNPSLQLQTSDNAFDWTALTEISIENIQWSSRSVPIGTTDELEIMTLSFKAPVWISPPAILQRQKLIHTIVTNIIESDAVTDDILGSGYGVEWSDSDLLARAIVTPENHAIGVEGNVITLLNSANGVVDSNNSVYPWEPLLKMYGSFRPGISMISLNPTNDFENHDLDIKGTIDYGPYENQLSWQIDPLTLPSNTLEPITAVIEPHDTFPGHGLASPVKGTRYLLLSDIGDSIAWGSLTAKTNDIIEYDGSKWIIAFVSSIETNNIHFILNQFNNQQLKWNGSGWIYAINGIYERGYWRILL